MGIKFESPQELAMFMDKFLHSEEGAQSLTTLVTEENIGDQYFQYEEEELKDIWVVGHQLEKFINIHGI